MDEEMRTEVTGKVDPRPVRGELPSDNIEIRIFTLADHAEAIASNGKLYINGAGITSIGMGTIPSGLPPISLALRLAIPWHKRTEPVRITIRVLNEDRTAVVPEPLLDVPAEVGRPPGMRPGDEAAVNAAIALGGLPIAREGTIYFQLDADGETIARLPLKLTRLRVAIGPIAQ